MMIPPLFWGEVERGRYIGFLPNGKRVYELVVLDRYQTNQKVVYSVCRSKSMV